MKTLVTLLMLLILGLALGGGAAFGVAQLLGPPPPSGAEAHEEARTIFVSAGTILAPVVAADGRLSGYANFDVQLEVDAEKEAEVTVFLMADAVLCAKAGQKTPDGYYNLERMLRRVLSAKGRVLMCGTCLDARGLAVEEMLEGAARSSMDELAETTLAADKVLVF